MTPPAHTEHTLVKAAVTIDDPLYTLLVETRDAVLNLSTKLDHLTDDSQDHESRIRTLERTVWKWAGAAAVLGSAGGYFLPQLFAA